MPDRGTTIGLVGAGRIARLIHLPVLARLDGVRLIGVADPGDGARATATALVPGIALYRNLQEMLEAVPVDAVVVCAPSAAHAKIARSAFAAGKSVYLEKPIALTVADGRTVVAAQREAGTVGMTGFMLRFSRPFVEARALIASGAIGEIVGAYSVFTSPPVASPAWRLNPSTGGGALIDLLSHHADITRWLLGSDVTSVVADLRSLRTEGDTASVRMRTESGVALQALISTSAAEDHRLELVGTEGRLAVDPWRMAFPERFAAAAETSRAARLRVLAPRRLLHRPDYRAPFRSALSAFTAAVAAGRSASPDLTDGLKSLAVVEAARRAAVSHREEIVAPIAPSPAGLDAVSVTPGGARLPKR